MLRIYDNTKKFSSTFSFMSLFFLKNWQYYFFMFILAPTLCLIYGYFCVVIRKITDENGLTLSNEEGIARMLLFSTIPCSIFLIPLSIHILFNSSLNYLFVINHVKKMYLAISVFLINGVSCLISMLNSLWVSLILFRSGFNLSPAWNIGVPELIYSVFITILFQSTLAVALAFLVKKKTTLIIWNITIFTSAFLLGGLILGNESTYDEKIYYYTSLLQPHNYLTSMLQMSFLHSTYYYVGGMKNMNGDLFNPTRDFMYNYGYPLYAYMYRTSSYIWLCWFVPYLWIIALWILIAMRKMTKLLAFQNV